MPMHKGGKKSRKHGKGDRSFPIPDGELMPFLSVTS